MKQPNKPLPKKKTETEISIENKRDRALRGIRNAITFAQRQRAMKTLARIDRSLETR